MAQPTVQKKTSGQSPSKKKSFLSTLTGSLKAFSKPAGNDSMGVPNKAGMSTQKYLKIKGIRDGVVELEDGSFRSIIMASSVNFALMSGEEQKAMIFGYQDFLNSLEFPIQILVQSRILNIDSYLAKLEEVERMQENELLRVQTAEYREYVGSLIEMSNITTNHYYVIVPYTGSKTGGSKDSTLDKVKEMINPAREAKVEITSYDKAIEELRLRVSRVSGGLHSMGIQAAQLNTQEVVELYYATYNPELSATEVLAELESLKIET